MNGPRRFGGGPVPEPAKPEPDDLQPASNWQRGRRAVTGWLKEWATVIALVIGGILLLSGLVRWAVGGYVDSLNKRIDDQNTAITTQGATVTDRIDLQTQSVKEVLTERISRESDVLTIKIDHVDEKLDGISERLDRVDARIDRVVTTDISRHGIASRPEDSDGS